MPDDHSSAARALSLPLSPTQPAATSSPAAEPSPSFSSPEPSPLPGPLPPWARAAQSPSNPRRRLSTPYSRSAAAHQDNTLWARALRLGTGAARHALRLYLGLSPAQRVLASLAGAVLVVLVVLGLVYGHRIFALLGPVAARWRALPGGWLIIWLLTFGTAFPPVIGYSTCVSTAGFVYGWAGWPIVATATVAGSTCSFFTSRTIFSRYVDGLVGADRRFVALGQVLRHDGLWVLAAIRFCPLPYSLSNGFLATIPSIRPWTFAGATALATPKLLVHVFIGSRLALLGDDMSLADKVVNYLSMLLGAVLGTVVGLVIYRRTMARARELAAQEAAEAGGAALVDDRGGGPADYDDMERGVLLARDGEADAAALMDDDDLSLWETDGVELGYRDGAEDDEVGKPRPT